MNRIYLLLLLFNYILNLSAQNSQSYFKVPPSSFTNEVIPSWAELMYSANPNVDEVVEQFNTYYLTNLFVKSVHTQNYKYWLKSVQDFLGTDGFITPLNAQGFEEHTQAINQLRHFNTKSSSIWRNIGPFNTYKNDGSLNLRPTQANVTSIAVAPSNNDIMYCGAATGGGVFKSIDHGLSWEIATLNYPITDASDIKIHPLNPNIVYISNGNKIYKTIDGGVTWVLNYSASGTIEQFYIHRISPNIVYAATENGLLKSTNDGVNWTNVLNKKCWDIKAHPINPDTIYVSISNSVAKRAEIYKTIDNGVNWSLKDSLWYTPTDIANASDIGCKIGVTPADPERVYACLIGNSKTGDNGWIGVYYSLDGANSWVNASGTDGGPYISGNNVNTNWFVAGYSSGYHQGWYNFDLDVSHVDPDKIWIGTIWSCESSNRGANIEYIRGTRSLEMHADVQDIDVVGNEIWYTSDGGINYSIDEMQSVEIRNTGISASTYWGFNQGWNEDIWTGGRYHNGDAVFNENYGAGNTMFLGGAETATGYINPLDNKLMHFSDISDKIVPDDLSTPSTNVSNLSIYPNEAYTLLNSSEIEYHPNYSNHMYLGKNNIFYKSVDGGVSFDSLFIFSATARVLEFEISRLDPNTIFCVVRDNGAGLIYKSMDGGNSFIPVSVIPSNNISRLDLSLDPNSTTNLWVSTAYGSNGQKVYSSSDGGVSWVNRTSPILDGHRIRDILYQANSNDLVYIVSNEAVFYWDDNISDWILYSDGLPFYTRALNFKPFYRDSKLRLSSDRGIWEATFAKPFLPSAEPITRNNIISCTRDTVQFEDYSILNHNNAMWNWSFSPAPSFISSNSVRNPKVLFTNPGSYDVTLTITDSLGNSSTKTVVGMVTVENSCDPDTIPGNSLMCYNSGDYGIIPDLELNQVDNFTISAWIKPAGTQPAYSGIVFNDGASAGLNFRGNNELAYHWPGGSWGWSSGLFVDSEVWSHVVMVVKPTGISLYLNGVESTNSINISPTDIGSMKIGSYKGWNSRNYTGEIDEVCIWNKALTQNEIRELKHLTRTAPVSYSGDLIAYFQFNLNGSSRIMDKIGIKHGYLNGNAQKVLSTAPVGGGVSNRIPVNTNGQYSFGNTGLTISLPTSGAYPNGDFVVSRINLLPDSLPSNNPSINSYWIVNNYGTSNFSPLDSIIFTTNNGIVYGNFNDARLFTRSENEHKNNWIEKCSAINYNNERYNFDVGCGINNTYQLFIQSDNLNEILKQYFTKNQYDTICSNDSILLAGEFQNQSGIYIDTIAVSSVLDSIFINHLTVLNAPNRIDMEVACGVYTWIDGVTYTSSNNIATYILTNSQGCDSVVTLNLTINSPSTETDVQVSCGSYTWIDGVTYTSSNNIATYTLTNSQGCDSVVALNLTINSPSTGTDVQVSCGSYTWIDGVTYTSSNNIATYTLTNSQGCDSVVTLNLTINSPSTGTDVQVSCGSYTWIDGVTYTSSNNIATYTLTNSQGCDSVVTLNLTIVSINLSITQLGSTLKSAQIGAEYQWLTCPNMDIISGAMSQSFTPNENGEYALIVDYNECSDTSNCYMVSTVGIINNDFGDEFLIYPNPTQGYFSIDLGKKYNVILVSISDLNGKIIQTNNYYEEQLLNLTIDEAAGIYLLMIKSEDKRALIRIVKE